MFQLSGFYCRALGFRVSSLGFSAAADWVFGLQCYVSATGKTLNPKP